MPMIHPEDIPALSSADRAGDFHQPLKIDQLASSVGMSISSLHHHFKAVTAMTPMQYQKQLRLNEARRLMRVETPDAGTAGYRVGYQSASQFSREYRRLCGQSPARDSRQQAVSAETVPPPQNRLEAFGGFHRNGEGAQARRGVKNLAVDHDLIRLGFTHQ
ncbi:AraC-like DNA-binding protein [Pantoea anthophila]|nr:AraC-like DNA-binding protein [Pantoea anthophila]